MSITTKFSFCAAVCLCLFGLVPESHANQPYQDIWSCLYTRLGWNVPNGQWRFDVQVSRDGNAIYIGNNNSHFTILKGVGGYHFSINGNNGGQQPANHIPDLLFACNKHEKCSTQIMDALHYLHNHCP